MSFSDFHNKGFTLVELLLAMVIVAVIAALVVPALSTRYQRMLMQRSYDKYVVNLMDLVGRLPMIENVSSFDQTSLYQPVGLNDLSTDLLKKSSEKFLKNNFKIVEYCGNYQANFLSGNSCLPSSYMSQEVTNNGTNKKVTDLSDSDEDKLSVYSCAKIKGGAVLCIRPQVLLRTEETGANHSGVDSHPATKSVTGWIDLNGKKGPNTIGLDMREFSLPRQRVSLSRSITEVSTSNVSDYSWECSDTSKYQPLCCAGWLDNDTAWNKISNDVKIACCNYTQGEDSKWKKGSKCCKLGVTAHAKADECGVILPDVKPDDPGVVKPDDPGVLDPIDGGGLKPIDVGGRIDFGDVKPIKP